MGYDLSKRLDKLSKEADENGKGITFLRIFFVAFLFFFFVSFLFSSPQKAEVPDPEEATGVQVSREAASPGLDTATNQLLKRLNPSRAAKIEERSRALADRKAPPAVKTTSVRDKHYKSSEKRIAWLRSIPIWGTLVSSLYESYAESIISSLASDTAQAKEGNQGLLSWINPLDWPAKFMNFLIYPLLVFAFIVIGFGPLWILAGSLAYWIARTSLKPTRTNDILGICHRGKGPFYSGIYGPFDPNGSFSGTELSAPSLACPEMEKESVAYNHKLGGLLRKGSSLNRTNLALIRIILAYKDFPSPVEEEQPVEKEAEQNPNEDPENIGEQLPKGVLAGKFENLETSSFRMISAALEAHRAARHLTKELGKKKGGFSFAGYQAVVEKYIEQVSPLAGILLRSLTPERARSISGLHPAIIASAVLAIEAGKCLVFKRVGSSFTQISRYPHLQARAVIQSIPAYHSEYKGDERHIIRQAIICSRRHGDFGRAFLPYNMPTVGRALRDWLEVFYASEEHQKESAALTELDAHIEEIYNDWKKNFRTLLIEQEKSKGKSSKNKKLSRWWKGIVYKSVVLVPVKDLLQVCFDSVPKEREHRIYTLLDDTRGIRRELGISARLPGFKRQAVDVLAGKEVSEIVKALRKKQDDDSILRRWRISRRMLIRYNWLSTRVGDDSVPDDGLVCGAIEPQEKGKNPPVRFSALTPLRQRRFKELFGPEWERALYSDAPHPNNIHIFSLLGELNEHLTEERNSQSDSQTDDQATAAGAAS